MYVHIYRCMYIIRVCMHVYTYIYIYIYIHTYACIHLHVQHVHHTLKMWKPTKSAICAIFFVLNIFLFFCNIVQWTLKKHRPFCSLYFNYTMITDTISHRFLWVFTPTATQYSIVDNYVHEVLFSCSQSVWWLVPGQVRKHLILQLRISDSRYHWLHFQTSRRLPRHHSDPLAFHFHSVQQLKGFFNRFPWLKWKTITTLHFPPSWQDTFIHICLRSLQPMEPALQVNTALRKAKASYRHTRIVLESYRLKFQGIFGSWAAWHGSQGNCDPDTPSTLIVCRQSQVPLSARQPAEGKKRREKEHCSRWCVVVSHVQATWAPFAQSVWLKEPLGLKHTRVLRGKVCTEMLTHTSVAAMLSAIKHVCS